MQKEIFEQPEAIENTLQMAIDARGVSPNVFGAEAGRPLVDVCSPTTRPCSAATASTSRAIWQSLLA
jgi:glucosamine--fructose-6-phosphate aminotransferase (isomerizing)